MAWLKVDDRIRTHPKIVEAGPVAAWVWLCGICYCREHLTDGFIADKMLATLVPGLSSIKKSAEALVNANLWHRVERGYQVHDFLDWNPSRADVEKQRASDRARKERGIQTDSSRNPDGPPLDSSRTRDAHGGLGSASVSAPVVSGSLEGVPGEQPKLPQRVGVAMRAEALGIVRSTEWDRLHGKHVSGFCDWVCLPRSVFDEFVRRVMGAGADEVAASIQVRAWADGVRGAWSGRIPGADIFAFWRNEWATTHGSNKPAAMAGVGHGDAIREALRNV